MTWAEQVRVSEIVAALSAEERARKVWAEKDVVRAARDKEQTGKRWSHISFLDLSHHNVGGYVLAARDREGQQRILFADGTQHTLSR